MGAEQRIGLPQGVRACLFDLDGVLTDTAAVHAKAWKSAFDELLRRRDSDEEFDVASDYPKYVDGLPRLDGVRGFLASRGIELPDGDEGDDSWDTVTGLGSIKNDRLQELIEREGVEVFEASRRYLERAREAGLATAVVSSSANTQRVLEVTGIGDLLDVRVDAIVAKEKGLRGKPAPDTFLHAADLLGVQPDQAVVFEDALSGVEAGAAGGFAMVVGVDRADQRQALLDGGADVVVQELDELMPA